MPLNRQFSGAIEVGRERSDSTPFLERWCSCAADEPSATMVAKLALWINVGQFLVDMCAGETERYTKAARVVVALNATTLWRVVDLSIGAYFFFVLDELTPSTLVDSSPIDLPLLILDFMDVPLLALSVWALYTMEQQVSLTPAPMLY